MTAFHCPICQAKLQPNSQGFSCEQRHQFDIAKEGYVNLLPVQHKKSKNPGDDAQMVQARRAFLAAGYYQFLQQSLIKTIHNCVKEIAELTTTARPINILDSGCGEGYYTNSLSNHLTHHSDCKATVYGIDIAKTAIRYAAKRGPNSQYAVASSHALPFATHSIDVLYKVFAPMASEEIKRVLSPTGHFISVVPGPRHLQQLRERIYKQVTPHQSEQTPNGFKLKSTTNQQKQVILTQSADIQHLCQMTPFAWKLSKQLQNELFGEGNNKGNNKGNSEENSEGNEQINSEGKAKQNSKKSFTVDFDFTINAYQLR